MKIKNRYISKNLTKFKYVPQHEKRTAFSMSS